MRPSSNVEKLRDITHAGLVSHFDSAGPVLSSLYFFHHGPVENRPSNTQQYLSDNGGSSEQQLRKEESLPGP
jgi:hypothetical protein